MNPRRLVLAAVIALVASAAGAADWKPEGPEHADVTALLVDPAQPALLFAATDGGGFFKSSDSGATWTLVGAQLAGRDVRWLQRDPRNKATLYVGFKDHAAIWRSTDSGASWKPMRFPETLPLHPDRLAFVPGTTGGMWFPGRNLHYRSNDGGTTWTEFRVSEVDVRGFVFDPKNARVVWAVGSDGGAGIRKSSDGGATWKAPAAEGVSRPSTAEQLVLDPANPQRLYLGTLGGHLYRSEDDGATFKDLALGLRGFSNFHDIVLENGSRTVYAVTDKGFLKSLDRGDSWETLKRRLPRYYVQAMALHPTAPDTVWAAPGGRGVYVSQDGGGSWAPSRTGLVGGWIRKIWADPVNAGTLFVDTNAGVHRKDAKGWHDLSDPMALGDEPNVHAVVFDRKNPRAVCVGDGAKLICSNDGGGLWSERVKGMPSPHPSFEGFVQDVADPKVFYSASWATDKPEDSVLKSIDGGVKWKTSGRGLPKDNVVLMRHEAPKQLLVLMKENGLFRSGDGAVSWTKAGTGLPSKDLRELVIDPATQTNVYVATKQGVYRSTDAGASFSLSNQGLKNTDVESVAVAPTGGRVFAATFEGVFESKDSGATWTLFSAPGLVNKDVRALAIGAGHLYAGTAGSGVYSIELPQ